MKAAVLKGPYDINVTDTERPEIGDDQVLIRVKRCGICGSDIHAYKGKHPDFIIPIIPGHEFSGVIEEVGSSVKRVKEGDRVVVEPLKVCGKCYYCRRGAYNKCTNLKVLGAQVNGAFAEYIAVDERWVYRLPDNVSFEEGAMVEPLAVAVHAVKRANHIGNNVLVLGSGTIGLLLAQVLKIYGASEVIVTDIKDWKLNLAKEFGAITVNPLKDDLKEAIDRVTGGIGVDSSFEAVGNEETLN
ncbi:MAG: alcohol dehydrogenase, partial [Thermoprotei archaeon]